MLFVNGRETLAPVTEPRREQDEIAIQNLVYVIEACSRRLGRARGGRTYLAEILGVQAPYLSVLTNRYEGRNLGRELKGKIEAAFNLDPGWMDHAHDASIVAWLLERVPSRPRRRNTGNQADPTSYAELERKLHELERQISELKSGLGSKSSTRK